jgi:hypothetical protein
VKQIYKGAIRIKEGIKMLCIRDMEIEGGGRENRTDEGNLLSQGNLNWKAWTK